MPSTSVAFRCGGHAESGGTGGNVGFPDRERRARGRGAIGVVAMPWNDWLSAQPATVSGQLSIVELRDTGGLDDEALIAMLGRELRRNYVDPKALEVLFDDLGAPEVAAHIRNRVLPTDTKVRIGEFGETVATALFRLSYRYSVPILKLRFKDSPNDPMKGTDLLAFRLRATPPVVAAPEVKTHTQTRRRLELGEKAEHSLSIALVRLDESINFVVRMLTMRGHTALAVSIGRIMLGTRIVERHMVFVHESCSFSQEMMTRLEAALAGPTTAHVLRRERLAELIDAVYLAAENDLQAAP